MHVLLVKTCAENVMNILYSSLEQMDELVHLMIMNRSRDGRFQVSREDRQFLFVC